MLSFGSLIHAGGGADWSAFFPVLVRLELFDSDKGSLDYVTAPELLSLKEAG